jgi:hypothetical protein
MPDTGPNTMRRWRETIRFPGDIYVLFGISSAVFWCGGWPDLVGFLEELLAGKIKEMIQIAIGFAAQAGGSTRDSKCSQQSWSISRNALGWHPVHLADQGALFVKRSNAPRALPGSIAWKIVATRGLAEPNCKTNESF